MRNFMVLQYNTSIVRCNTDIEMEYTLTKHIGDSQKYFGSSTDTNNDENIQRTFEVEVCIERQPRRYSDDTEETRQYSKNETTSKTETNSIKEETSADELTEDSSEDEEQDEVDQKNCDEEEFDEKQIIEENKIITNGIEEDQYNDQEETIINLSNSQDSLKKQETNNNESKNATQNIDSQESINSKSKLTSESFTNVGNTLSDEEELRIEKNTLNDEEEFEIEHKNENEEDVENISLIKKSPKSENGSFSMEISSKRPSSFNSEDYPFQLSFQNNKRSLPDFRTRVINQNRNLSFSNERMREIDRSNQILLRKILTQKSAYETRNLIRSKQKQTVLYKNNRQTSAAINRKKQQRQIEMDNQVLKRKLEAIAYRNPLH